MPDVGHQQTRIPGGRAGERFGLDEFVARVAERDTTDLPAATYRARVVLELLDEATTGGLMDEMTEGLPDDVRTLIEAGSSGRLGGCFRAQAAPARVAPFRDLARLRTAPASGRPSGRVSPSP
jgi:hypothetical protein